MYQRLPPKLHILGHGTSGHGLSMLLFMIMLVDKVLSTNMIINNEPLDTLGGVPGPNS